MLVLAGMLPTLLELSMWPREKLRPRLTPTMPPTAMLDSLLLVPMLVPLVPTPMPELLPLVLAMLLLVTLLPTLVLELSTPPMLESAPTTLEPRFFARQCIVSDQKTTAISVCW